MSKTAYEIKTELRPCVCKINGSWVKSLFHGWMRESNDSFIYALVELSNGFMGKAKYDEFYFLDSRGKFSEYSFNEDGVK